MKNALIQTRFSNAVIGKILLKRRVPRESEQALRYTLLLVKLMLKTRTWIIIIAVIFAVAALACIFLYMDTGTGTTAEVWLDGELVRTVRLNELTEPYKFTVTTADGEGTNTILVENGKIRVSEANCPDGICVNDGWLKGSAPIVCLPHRLVIKFADGDSENEVDTVTK